MARLWRRRGSPFSTGVSAFPTPFGRSALLSLHLFAVLHRVKEEGPDGRTLAQELVDRFSRDMETVLRELGVSDLRIPKSMPHQATRLAAGLLGRLHRGPSLLCQCHRGNLAGETLNVELSSKILASYLTVCVRARAAAICEEARSIFQR